ncbi:MAG: hypothetical protein VX681_14825 [Myxococcota bacterium]|nr:hypothetical protein [Myxococcota bacterium]
MESQRSNGGCSPFFLYVEGARDQEILRSWARRLSRPLERAIDESSVIMGGRQPARAIELFRREAQRSVSARGLCVLDRDDGELLLDDSVPGLEFFTWPRRHIESYLLVATAIWRYAHRGAALERIEQLLRDDGRSPEQTHAKTLLAPKGRLAQELGRSISAAGVARAMRSDEIHPDVHALFDRVYEATGLRRPAPVVVHRRAQARDPSRRR